jgi:peptide-methionine (S)-S-oxide reductase
MVLTVSQFTVLLDLGRSLSPKNLREEDAMDIGKLMGMLNADKTQMVSAEDALPGRSEPGFPVPETHAVLDTPLKPPFPEGIEVAYFALGCFWGAEQLFWRLDGVYSTAVGYQEGTTPNPTYEEVCSGKTGHAEAVMVAYDPTKVSYEDLLKVFFEEHDPTQGMRQGNDVGTQYRSGIYFNNDAQKETAERVRDAYEADLRSAGKESVTTEIALAGTFYYAEDYHQQYLHKVPNGYCGLGGTGVSCPVGIAAA